QGQAAPARPLPAPAQDGKQNHAEKGGVTRRALRPSLTPKPCAPFPPFRLIGLPDKTGYAMPAALIEDLRLMPDNDASPAPFGAFAPNVAQAAIIRLAQRSRLKRGAFRPMLSRLVNLMRAGPVDVHYQGASFRFYHQFSATERGALFNPDY